MGFFYKILRMPALHFIVIGALLFVFQQMWDFYTLKKNPPPQDEIIISSAQIEQLKEDIKAQTGLEPNAFQIQAAISTAIDDEILYRRALDLKLDEINLGVRHRLIQIARFMETSAASDSEDALYRKALELGLDRSDPVVRRQLIANMKLVLQKVPRAQDSKKLSQEEIQSYYDQKAEIFLRPERYTLKHIYVSRDRWGKKAEVEAKRRLKELQSQQIQPSDPTAVGDLFLRGNSFSAATPSALQNLFGANFASQLEPLKPGQWQGPILSSYGWHLVWIVEKTDPQKPALTEVMNQVKGNLLQERDVLRLEDALKELRLHYQIRVEGAFHG